MRFALFLFASLTFGCDALHEELPGLLVVSPRQPVATELAAQPSDGLAQLARQLEARFKPPALPSWGAESECARPRELAGDADARRLVLANLDVRTQTRSLLSRRVSERLESGEPALLSTALDASSSPADVRHNAPAGALSVTLEDLRRMQKQRYLGVFYFTEYHGPALILRVGKIRREWFEGQLRAKFVLFDTETQRMICGTELRVVNDVKSAPIRSRLQAETRNRLERALGDALRAAAERALSHLTPQLEWPDSATQAQ